MVHNGTLLFQPHLGPARMAGLVRWLDLHRPAKLAGLVRWLDLREPIGLQTGWLGPAKLAALANARWPHYRDSTVHVFVYSYV